VFWQFKEAVGGMAEACTALDTPVTGGNVSLYNESPTGAVYPTPTIGMVGVLDDVSHATGMTFRAAGDPIVLLGDPTDELGASEYLSWVHGVVAGAPPTCNLARERALIDAIVESIQAGHVKSAHDCSEGGFAVALSECCIADRNAPMGATVSLAHWDAIPERALLFGEAQGRIIVTASNLPALLAVAKKHAVPAHLIGSTAPAAAGLTITGAGRGLAATLPELSDAYHGALERAMSRAVSSELPVAEVMA
jgi:phosphoribosylformylglycinamidine synthase